MKKISICLFLTCLLICVSGLTFATNFNDIKGTMYEGVVDRISSLGIVNGVSKNVFAANKGITRGEIAKMIVYVRGLQDYADDYELPITFSDTKSHWAKNYIQVAVDLGLLKGYEDGTFRPDKEVSYAETIAIVLRSLGYVNISETSGTTWYSAYVKRMYEIGLDKGISSFSSYTAPAKRGDVAILWWNMLISDRWAIESESEGAGMYYTYSEETQLEKLFPEAKYVRGTVKSIKNGISGDSIAVQIDGTWYDTESDVPIISLGATGVGVYDQKTKMLYGFSIDDDLEDYKVVSGPIFYLKDQGYKVNNSKTEYAYGGKTTATYAHLLVSNSTGNILRSVLIDGSDSVVIDSVKVQYPDSKKSGDGESGEKRVGKVYINTSEVSGDEFTTTKAVVIKNGKKIEWDKIPQNAVLTTLIKNSLYTYETKSFEGEITDYSKTKEMYVDSDKYLIASSCVYTIAEKTSGDNKKTLKQYPYSNLTKKKIEELTARRITFYLNAAEEISKIEFGNYLSENVSEKYENSSYKLFYIQKINFPIEETHITLVGNTFDGKYVRCEVEDKDGKYQIGDLIYAEYNSSGDIQKCQAISSNTVLSEDIRINYGIKASYENGAIGEYRVTDNTNVYKINKKYPDNRTDKLESCTLTKLTNVDELGDLSNYKVILVCNEYMDIDVVLAEKEINKMAYPIARVISMSKEKKSGDTESVVSIYSTKLDVIGGASLTCKALSGDLMVGELITFDGSGDKLITVKERFKTELLGYEKDVVIQAIDKRTKEITVEGTSNKLNLKDEKFSINANTYYLDDYQYLLAYVRQDKESDNWLFTSGKFYDKKDLELKIGDRIAFDELNGVAVIYRGYSN